MGLDFVDFTILQELEYNARITDKQLAKLTYKSKDTIKYRINKLKKQNYILSQNSFVDYTKLGKTSYKIYLTISASKEEYDKLYGWSEKQKEIFCIFEAQTGWHLCLALFCDGVLDFEKIQQEIFLSFGNIIIGHYISQMTRAIEYSHTLKKDSIQKSLSIFGDILVNELDEYDCKLVQELFVDSSRSYLDLTKSVGLSIEPIIRRTKRLQSKKIITYFGTAINYEKIGLTKYKLFFKLKSMNDQHEKTLQTFLETFHQLKNIIYLIGPYRMEVEFFVNNHVEIYAIVKKIKETFPEYIANIEYTIFHSENFYPAGLLLN